MPPKSSAKKRGEGKQAAAAAEGSEDHSDLENPSVSSKESEYAAETARILDEALDRMTSDKQKQALLKVVTKFQNLTPVQIENAALLIQHYRHYSEYEETIFKLIGGAPAASEFLEEPPQLSATEVTQLANFRKSLTMNEPKAKQSIKETLDKFMKRARESAISSATFNLKEQEDLNSVWNNVTGAVNATGEASFGQLTTFSKLTASALVEVLSRSHKGAYTGTPGSSSGTSYKKPQSAKEYMKNLQDNVDKGATILERELPPHVKGPCYIVNSQFGNPEHDREREYLASLAEEYARTFYHNELTSSKLMYYLMVAELLRTVFKFVSLVTEVLQEGGVASAFALKDHLNALYRMDASRIPDITVAPYYELMAMEHHANVSGLYLGISVSALNDAFRQGSADTNGLDNIATIFSYPFDGANSYLDLADFVALVDSTREQVQHPDDPTSLHPALQSSVLLQVVIARLSAKQYPVEDRTIMRDLLQKGISGDIKTLHEFMSAMKELVAKGLFSASRPSDENSHALAAVVKLPAADVPRQRPTKENPQGAAAEEPAPLSRRQLKKNARAASHQAAQAAFPPEPPKKSDGKSAAAAPSKSAGRSDSKPDPKFRSSQQQHELNAQFYISNVDKLKTIIVNLGINIGDVMTPVRFMGSPTLKWKSGARLSSEKFRSLTKDQKRTFYNVIGAFDPDRSNYVGAACAMQLQDLCGETPARAFTASQVPEQQQAQQQPVQAPPPPFFQMPYPNAAQAQQHFMPYGGITPQMMAAALHAQSNMSGAVSQSSFQPSSQEDAQKQLAQSSASSGDSLWGGGGFFK